MGVTLVPKPVEVRETGGSCPIRQDVEVIVSGEAEVGHAAEMLAQMLRQKTGHPVPVETLDEYRENREGIYFLPDPYIPGKSPERYLLTVEPNRIVLAAASFEGFARGIQALRQLFPTAAMQDVKIPLALPCVTIRDEPRFSWRGLNLDCSRHFMDVEFIKRYIDLLAYHRMNVFHWHLTDDHGWRIEIPGYPRLTGIGAWRKGKGGTPYGGYYTAGDIREVVQFAADRAVTVMPEIEMPGHSTAALAAYPELSCTGGPFEGATSWGIKKEVYCAGREETFTFLQAVLDRVMELFPSPYIHIGGDECLKTRWKKCPRCQARIKEEGLVNEEELQSYFISRMGHYIEENGRQFIGWDEILEGGIPPGAVVQSWRGTAGAVEAVHAGHRTIVSPTSHTYFDYGLARTDLAKVYGFDPVPEELSAEDASLVLGSEANMWTEYAPQHTIDSKVFPRLCALAEVLWTPEEERSLHDFRDRMQFHYARLEEMGVAFGLESESKLHMLRYLMRDARAFFGILAQDPGLALMHLRMYLGG